MPTGSADRHELRADELGLQFHLTLLGEELDDLTEVCVQLVQGRALAVGAPESRDVAHVEVRVWAPLDDRRVGLGHTHLL